MMKKGEEEGGNGDVRRTGKRKKEETGICEKEKKERQTGETGRYEAERRGRNEKQGDVKRKKKG